MWGKLQVSAGGPSFNSTLNTAWYNSQAGVRYVAYAAAHNTREAIINLKNQMLQMYVRAM